MDTDLKFALSDIKFLLERIESIVDKIGSHSSVAARNLDQIDDNVTSLKIDAVAIAKALREPDAPAPRDKPEPDKGLVWYVVGIFALLLMHVIHHW